MEQNKYVKLHSLLRMFAALLALVIFVSMFIATQIYREGMSHVNYSWNQTFFGDSVYNKASPAGFIGYLFILIGGLAGLAFVFIDELIGKDLTKKLAFGAGCLMVVGGALILLNGVFFRAINELSSEYHLAAGPIVFGILGVLAGAMDIAAPILEDKGL